MGRTLWTWTTRGALTLIVLVLVLAGTAFVYRAYQLRRVAIATSIDRVKGIDEATFVRIGGIDQWITIRGHDRDNPVLLLLHGGPGFPPNPARTLLFEWLNDFTVVQWHQRGAGKTFGRSGPVEARVTIERMALDGIELAELLRRTLQKPKIVLVGLSWGTILGIQMAKARPDLWHAYVGTGQIVRYQEGRALAYTQLLSEARFRGDRKAIDELETIGPGPYNSLSQSRMYTKWADAFEQGGPSTLSALHTTVFEAGMSFADLRDWIRGLRSSQDHFRDQYAAVDLTALGPDFAIPVFFFMGERDNVTPVPLVRQYVESIRAPHKALVAIADRGHTVMYTKSDEFRRHLVRAVRPLADDSGSP